jgi:4-hydroxymandelate oxidase
VTRTIRNLEQQAGDVLPPDIAAWFASGAGDEITAGEQEAAWSSLRLRPRILNDVSGASTATTVLGCNLETPVMVAPTALQGLVHPDGEVATAAGAREAGSLFVVSMRASRRIEDVAAAAGPHWQQIYVLQDRGISDEVARRAAAGGASALVLTVDTPFVTRKPAGFPASLPPVGLVPELDQRDIDDPRLMQAGDVTARDIGRLAEISGLPVVAKGVLRGDEAMRCVHAGASAVIVSAHGGRQLDAVVPVPLALPEVVAAVGDHAEVYADGGLRSAVHVLAALALGARAVLLGRPIIWALAVDGSDGVRDLLRGLSEDLRQTMALAGCSTTADIAADLVLRLPAAPHAAALN